MSSLVVAVKICMLMYNRQTYMCAMCVHVFLWELILFVGFLQDFLNGVCTNMMVLRQRKLSVCANVSVLCMQGMYPALLYIYIYIYSTHHAYVQIVHTYGTL